MSDGEKSSFVLPYRSTRAHVIKTLDIGQPSDKLWAEPVVRDSQVLFAIEMHLPPRAAVLAVTGVTLNMEISKVSRDAFLKTEMICHLESRLCSGQHYLREEGDWYGNLNPGYWTGASDTIPNDLFSRLVLKPKLAVNGKTLFYSRAAQLSVLEAFPALAPLEFLYGSSGDKARGAHTAFFAVADDTFVGNAELAVTLTYDSCVR